MEHWIARAGTLGFNETLDEAVAVVYEAAEVREWEHYIYWLEPVKRYYIVPRPSLSIWLSPGVFIKDLVPLACTANGYW